MSENVSQPFELDVDAAPDDPLAPAVVDETVAAYQTAAAPQDSSARLIVALAAMHAPPPEAEAILERVRQRVLRTASGPATPSASLDNHLRTREVAPPATLAPSRPAPTSIRTPSRVRKHSPRLPPCSSLRSWPVASSRCCATIP